MAFQEKVRTSYLRTLEYFRGKGLSVFVMDGDRPAGIIHSDIWNIVARLPIRGG